VKSLLKNHRATLIVLVISLVALCIRIPSLDSRPFHGDEANQAYKTGRDLLENGKYIYDPHDHHGPTLYYLTLIPAWIAGQDTFVETQDWTYRIVPVVFGAGLILIMLLLRPAMSTPMLIISGLLVCVSPAFVFYSRYYIQEMLLVFFTFAAIGFGYRYWLRPTHGYALATGASLSLMHATKETAIIAYASMGAGIVVLAYFYKKGRVVSEVQSAFRRSHLISFVTIALLVNIVLFTAFFTHASGPIDSLLTYGNYIKRADGAGLHEKPWYYYLQLLGYTNRGPQYWFSEGFALFGGAFGLCIIVFQQLRNKKPSPIFLFLSVYTVCMIVVYSGIAYKTPWTMLSLYHGIILLAGYGFSKVFESARAKSLKAVYICIFAIGLAHLGRQAYIQNVHIATDTRNPYVYAHTSSAALKMVDRAHQLKAVHPDPDNMVIFVIQPDGDYWPLPYYLRDIVNVGFYPNIPENPDLADMIIADPRARGLLSEAIEGDYAKEMGGLRPSVLRHIYIKRELWDAFMATQGEN
jgi:uncharacterized protein (TIGR03663 family)